jgi:hypothetical protein
MLKMKLLGKTKLYSKEYTIKDVKGFKDPSDFGLSDSFYGGRVDKIAGTNVVGLYMLVEKHNVIDLMILEEEYEGQEEDTQEVPLEEIPFTEDQEEDLRKLTNEELRNRLEQLGVEVPAKANKDELINLFSQA